MVRQLGGSSPAGQPCHAGGGAAMSGVLRKAGLALAGVIVLATLAQAQTESPVRIGNFSIDRNEVTVGAFRAYLGHSVGSSPQTEAEREGGGFEYAGGWARRPGWSWARPQGQPRQIRSPSPMSPGTKRGPSAQPVGAACRLWRNGGRPASPKPGRARPTGLSAAIPTRSLSAPTRRA